MALVCCILLIGKGYGQDLIIRTDNVQIQAKVLEIGANQIRFRRSESPDTVTYVISTRDVVTVQLADGTRRSFAPAVDPAQNIEYYNYETGWGRNMISWSVTDIFITNLTFAYERYANSGKFGVKVPVSIGLNPDPENYDGYWRGNRSFAAGLALNYYPFGQGRISYYLGPTAELGLANSYYWDYRDINNPQMLNTDVQVYTFTLNNGAYYHFTKSFMMVVDVGLGLRKASTDLEDRIYWYDRDRVKFVLPVSLQLGYRF